jgi:hypothetical protein
MFVLATHAPNETDVPLSFTGGNRNKQIAIGQGVDRNDLADSDGLGRGGVNFYQFDMGQGMDLEIDQANDFPNRGVALAESLAWFNATRSLVFCAKKPDGAKKFHQTRDLGGSS